MVGKTISLCITNYNRDRMLFDSFANVVNDDRVSEIVIADDCSGDVIWRKVEDYCRNIPKVKLFRNIKNLGCYKNKNYVISQAQNEYVIIFDSDNIITRSYIDKIYEQEWRPDVILAPDFVESFDYRHFGGQMITRQNVRGLVDKIRFDCMINTMNYFVHRDSYLKVWQDTVEPWTADTIFQNYNWLNSGRSIYVVPGLEYTHRINHNFREEKSHYKTHVRLTGNLFNDLMEKLKRMQ